MAEANQPNPDSRAIVFTEIEQFGGAERSALALARWLYDHNLPVHIVTYDDHCNLARYASHPLPVVEIPAKGTRNRIAALGRYFKQRPQKPLLSGYQPALHATLAGLRGFHDLMHDTPALFVDPQHWSLKTRLRISVSNRIIARGLQSGGATIVTSEFLRAECRRDFGIEAHIARMGGLTTADPANLFRIRPIAPGEPLRMLSVCRIESNKRIDWLLRSLAELERATPALSHVTDWRLDLAGKGPLIPELTKLAASLGLAHRVYFHGFVPDEQLQTLYDRAHLFLMPAVQGYGIPAVESLQRGIPVLLHRESGVSDILLDTPWATVLTGGPDSLTPALRAAIEGVLHGAHHATPLPPIPTEDQWAEQVARLCNWLP